MRVAGLLPLLLLCGLLSTAPGSSPDTGGTDSAGDEAVTMTVTPSR